VPEINGTIPYLANHPEAFERMAGVINMDMVGANQKEAKAIFVLTRTPHSLPTYFDDVIQHFTEYARDSNREPSGRNETLTIIAPTGTRDNFDVEIVDYGGGSDHYIFVDGAIRIPAVMFGTWPDVFYHSSEDKPDKVDPTTLKRAIFLGVSSAIYFAQATSEDVPRLAMEVMS
jgi:aminopeptidase YwaD